MKKTFLFVAAIALLGTLAMSANANDVNTFSEEFTNTDNFNGSVWAEIKPWMVVANGQLSKPDPGGWNVLSTNQVFTPNCVFRTKFRSNMAEGTYGYLGWYAFGWTGYPLPSWPGITTYVRLSGQGNNIGFINLMVQNGEGMQNAYALGDDVIVTGSEWHTLQIVWKEGSVGVSLDGISLGTFSSSTIVPTAAMEMQLGTGGAAGQVIDFDYVSVTPLYGSIGGMINLLDFGGDRTLNPVRVDFFEPGTSVVVKSATLTLDDSGAYQIDKVEAGNYDIAFSSSKCLRKLVSTEVVAGSSVTTVSVDLINGDIDGDNEVTSTDLSILGLNLGLAGD